MLSVNQLIQLHQNEKRKNLLHIFCLSSWNAGLCVPNNATNAWQTFKPPPHLPPAQPSHPPPPLFLSQAMMRGSCKQLISSLFAHMCLTPHGPQWVLGLCSDTISSANIDHRKKGKKTQNNSSSGWSVQVSLTRVTVWKDGDAVCPPNQGPATRNSRYKLKYQRRESSVKV